MTRSKLTIAKSVLASLEQEEEVLAAMAANTLDVNADLLDAKLESLSDRITRARDAVAALQEGA